MKELHRAKIWKKNSKVEGLTLSDFKSCYKTTVIKSA